MNPNQQQNPGAIKKVGDFLGVSKFGQGLATAGRVLTGATGQDIARQEENTAQVNKITYAAKQEKDPIKRTKLLQLASSMGKIGTEMGASEIDPGLNLSNKEILGSAANIGLNILTPGGFKGGAGAVIGKNAALGAGFGAATGLEKNRSAKGIVGSTIGGALIGGGIGLANVGAKAIKDFTTKTTPEWLMNNAIKPTLDEARKTIKYGQESFGKELLKEGVSGGPKKILEIADSKLNTLEDNLQDILNHPSLADAKVTKKQLEPYFQDLMTAKSGVPGLGGDVQRIKNVIDGIPESMNLQQANVMKRRIYNELRDVSYKLDAKLGTKAKALKQLASGLKQEIENQAGGIGGEQIRNINQKLGLYGKLENRVVDQLARSMKNNSFGLTDAILASGGIASMNPIALLGTLGVIGVKHSGTAVETGLAKGLSKLGSVGTGKTAQTIQGGIKRGVLNLP